MRDTVRVADVGSLTDPTARRTGRAKSSSPWLDRWMALLRAIGNIQAWVILSVFYVFVILPMGVVVFRRF